MMRLQNLTLRNALIAAHDALATAAALFVSFYLRFEGDAFYDRVPLLLRILPYFVVFSVVVCYVFKLTTTKWRFISLPDALNILQGGDDADARAGGAGLCVRRAATAARSSSAGSPSSCTAFWRCSS